MFSNFFGISVIVILSFMKTNNSIQKLDFVAPIEYHNDDYGFREVSLM